MEKCVKSETLQKPAQVSFSKDVCQVFISTPSQNGKWSAFRKQERKLFSMKELQLNDLLHKEGCNRLGDLQWTQPSLSRLQATPLLQPSLPKNVCFVKLVVCMS